jgi:hypothetical protein
MYILESIIIFLLLLKILPLIDEYVDNIGKLLSFLIKKIIYIVIYYTTIRIIIFWYSLTFDILSELVNNIKNTNLDNMNLDYLYKSFHLNFDE